jgi:hypothetical protein
MPEVDPAMMQCNADCPCKRRGGDKSGVCGALSVTEGRVQRLHSNTNATKVSPSSKSLR